MNCIQVYVLLVAMDGVVSSHLEQGYITKI